jgi:hypothetical protein
LWRSQPSITRPGRAKERSVRVQRFKTVDCVTDDPVDCGR